VAEGALAQQWRRFRPGGRPPDERAADVGLGAPTSCMISISSRRAWSGRTTVATVRAARRSARSPTPARRSEIPIVDVRRSNHWRSYRVCDSATVRSVAPAHRPPLTSRSGAASGSRHDAGSGLLSSVPTVDARSANVCLKRSSACVFETNSAPAIEPGVRRPSMAVAVRPSHPHSDTRTFPPTGSLVAER
jgi:hypothetical protein